MFKCNGQKAITGCSGVEGVPWVLLEVGTRVKMLLPLWPLLSAGWR